MKNARKSLKILENPGKLKNFLKNNLQTIVFSNSGVDRRCKNLEKYMNHNL